MDMLQYNIAIPFACAPLRGDDDATDGFGVSLHGREGRIAESSVNVNTKTADPRANPA